VAAEGSTGSKAAPASLAIQPTEPVPPPRISGIPLDGEPARAHGPPIFLIDCVFLI
jgi:hypothetical protein